MAKPSRPSDAWPGAGIVLHRDSVCLVPWVLGALIRGVHTQQALAQYCTWQAGCQVATVSRCQCQNAAGFRERLLADPGFFVKLGIELGIGLVCKITAEAQKRGEAFKGELDFVFANVVRCWRSHLRQRGQHEQHGTAPITQSRQHHFVARLVSEHQLL